MDMYYSRSLHMFCNRTCQTFQGSIWRDSVVVNCEVCTSWRNQATSPKEEIVVRQRKYPNKMSHYHQLRYLPQSHPVILLRGYYISLHIIYVGDCYCTENNRKINTKIRNRHKSRKWRLKRMPGPSNRVIPVYVGYAIVHTLQWDTDCYLFWCGNHKYLL